MRQKRVRDKLFQVWLHHKELEFLNDYADKNMSTSSEIVRGWLREIMKREVVSIKEPQIPENNKG